MNSAGDNNGFLVRERIKSAAAMIFAHSRCSDTPESQIRGHHLEHDPVDDGVPRGNKSGQPLAALDIAREIIGRERVRMMRVDQARNVVDVIERQDRQDGAEQFLFHQRVGPIHAVDDSGLQRARVRVSASAIDDFSGSSLDERNKMFDLLASNHLSGRSRIGKRRDDLFDHLSKEIILHP